MTTITESVVRQELRESRVSLQQKQNAAKVQPEKVKREETLTLPEIKIHLNDILKETQIKYTIDENDNGFIIKVMDKKTDKLIKEIPSHEIQVLREHFRTHMGVLFDELI
ncbi:MAG: flagellar protein FlaG [Spirochaetaceae bacterium]